MTTLVPYIAGAVTLLFGAAFYFGLQELKDHVDTIEENRPFDQ
ncbi:MAG: hypothetical protein R3301_11295 [Saprospiraceae bacterium]|nr:hypothetical protein [Saprospiraceae bacterium]